MVNLSIEGVDCFYESTKILENVSFSIKTGTFLGILGPNGSGKTTLLKSISRVLKPRAGAILIDDSNIYNMKTGDVAKNMAVVPQDSSITFSFTTLDIVLMGRTPHLARLQREGPEDLAIAKQAMQYTGTWEFADRLITELSGGERQRVIIARALTQQPKILLLDEPTSHLDISNQIEIMDILKQLCVEKQLLIVGVFHDFNLAARYCDSIILLKKGKIVGAGKAEETLTTESIKAVFGIDAIVNKHPVTGLPYVIPISKPKDQQQKNVFVHVICGAGTGSTLMKVLVDAGYNLTAGVLNVSDTDFQTAQYLKIPTAKESPFSPVTDAAQKENLAMIQKANIVVLTSVPFGSGNLQNMEAAKEALRLGKPTYVIDEVPIDLRDFTDGKAKKLYKELKKLGALLVSSECEILNMLKVNQEEMEIPKNTSITSDEHVNKEVCSEKK
ncbi:MAG: ABC transporter ATP-binding protein [Crenarchaeota archaeon]|nr:ABC transporter ATP-binding protein [Thermoproteota archaeon]